MQAYKKNKQIETSMDSRPVTRTAVLPVNQPKVDILGQIATKLIVDAFIKMPMGRLTLSLPNGELHSNNSTKDANPNNSINATINVHSYDFFKKCVSFGAIGFAESFMDGDWSTPDITEVIRWFILNADHSTVMEGSSQKAMLLDLFNIANRFVHLLRPNSKSISKKNISAHYDLSNNLFKLFLDSTMTYSSGLFTSASQSLEEAQINKYEKLCQSLMLKKGDRVLEIGCGWGGFACYAVENYGCTVDGITLSEQQFQYATGLVKQKGLESKIKIRLIDYRDVEGQYDKIASIEMVEALGDAYVDTFFQRVSDLLTKDGIASIQMISTPDSRYEQLKEGVDFIQKHIFPGSLLLSLERVVKATSKTSDLHLVELFDFAESYAHTLKLWHQNFNAKLDQVRELGFSEEFIKKWQYYFAYCEAAFDMRQISVLQVTLTRPNNQQIREQRRLS